MSQIDAAMIEMWLGSMQDLFEKMEHVAACEELALHMIVEHFLNS